MGLSEHQVKAEVKSIRPEKWVFKKDYKWIDQTRHNLERLKATQACRQVLSWHMLDSRLEDPDIVDDNIITIKRTI